MSLGKGWHQSSWATNTPLRGGSSSYTWPHHTSSDIMGGGGGWMDLPGRCTLLETKLRGGAEGHKVQVTAHAPKY